MKIHQEYFQIQKVRYSLTVLTLIMYLHFQQTMLVLTRRDNPQILEKENKHLLSCKHPACTLQKAKHVEDKLSPQIRLLNKTFQSFSPVCHRSIRITWHTSLCHLRIHLPLCLLFQISQITLVLNVKIACSSKLLKDDKDGQDAETPMVTEHCSPFLHSMIMCSVVSSRKC